MIEGGLECSLLTTGETMVFFKIDWNEPETVHHHLSEPGPEVVANPNNTHLCTSVGQLVAREGVGVRTRGRTVPKICMHLPPEHHMQFVRANMGRHNGGINAGSKT